MIAAMRATWVLFFGIGLMMLGNGLQGTLLGVRATLEDFDTAVTGIMMSGYFAGFFLGSLIVPRLLRNVGHVRIFSALSALASSSILLHAVLVDPWFWTLMRLVTGFCYAGMYIVSESWLNERAENANRGAMLSAYMIVMQSGMAGGQFLLGAGDPQGLGLFIIVSVLVSLAVVPMLVSTGPMPRFEEIERLSVRRVARGSPLAAVGTLLTGMTAAIILGIGPVYGVSIGLSVGQVALFMGVISLGVIVLQVPIGTLSDRFDRRTVLMVVAFASAGVAAVAALVGGSGSIWILLVVSGIFGGLALPIYALCNAHLNDFLETRHMVSGSATLLLIFGLGSVIGPSLAAGAMSAFGDSAFFWLISLIHVLIGVFALYRMTQRAAVPLEDQGPYLAMSPRSTAVAQTAWVDSELVEEDGEEEQAGGENGDPAPAASTTGG